MTKYFGNLKISSNDANNSTRENAYKKNILGTKYFG